MKEQMTEYTKDCPKISAKFEKIEKEFSYEDLVFLFREYEECINERID